MRHHDMSYAFPHGRDADPRTWASERAFFSGMGEADEATPTAVTPSGATTRQAETPWYQTAIQTIVPAAAAVYQQRQLTKLNIARINQGQAPMSADQYAEIYQPPAAQLQVGPTTRATNMLLWVGGGIALLVGLRAAKII